MKKINQEKRPVHTSVKDEYLVEKRRSELIRGAVQLFKQKGFHQTTTREIAKASGFSIGTLYEYIRTKEDVLYLLYDTFYEQVKIRLGEMEAQEGPLENVMRAATCYFQLMDEMQDEVMVMHQETKSLSKEVLPYVLRKEKEIAEMFEELLQRCVERGVLEMSKEFIQLTAQNIFMQGQMWVVRQRMLEKSFTLEKFIEMQTDLLFSGLNGCKKKSAHQ